ADTVADSGRRADADVHDGAHGVGVVVGPLAGAVAPAELGRADAVVDADRPVPRHAPVVFHVGVEAEQFAVGVEGDVVGVAESSEHQLPLLAVGIGAEDVAAGCHLAGGVAAGVGQAGKQEVFAVVPVRAGRA